MVEKNLIKAFIAIVLVFVAYNTGLWLLSQSLWVANLGGLLLLFIAMPSLVYRTIKHFSKHLKNKQKDENNH